MFFKLLKEGFLFAVNSIIVNKLRTFLSLFGITIGIFSIISVFTVLDWMEKAVHDSISSLGEDVIYVHKWPWGLTTDINWWDIMKWPSVSKNDYEAIINKSTRTQAACFLIDQGVPLKYKKNLASDIILYGVTNEFPELRTFEIENGRYFSSPEANSGTNVAILGHELADRLFNDVNPVGKQIAIRGNRTTVIGVFKKEGKGGLSDDGMDRIVVVPLNYANNFLDATVMLKPKPGVSIDELSDETTMILRAARRLKPDEENNFFLNRASVISQSFDSVFAGINVGGWIIGGFAILVGGFGIANIMFVSVRERTNQIGIQKALGAKRSFILQQFLVESVLLSVIGGLLGVFLIYIASLIINYLYDLNMFLTSTNIFLAVFISAIIGIVAGYAPAYAAARMDPVEAIGYTFG